MNRKLKVVNLLALFAVAFIFFIRYTSSNVILVAFFLAFMLSVASLEVINMDENRRRVWSVEIPYSISWFIIPLFILTVTF